MPVSERWVATGLERLRMTAILCYAAVILGNFGLLFSGAAWGRLMLAGVVAAGLLVGLLFASGTYRLVGSVLLVGGVLLFRSAWSPAELWSQGLLELQVMFTLLMVLPIMGIPLELGGYTRAFTWALSRFASRAAVRFHVATGVMFIIASLMTMGGAPVVYRLLRETAYRHSRQPERYLSRVILRGFGLSDILSPLSMAVVTVQFLTGGQVHRFLPLTAALVAAGIALNVVLERSYVREDEWTPLPEDGETVFRQAPRRFLELGAVLAVTTLLVSAAGFVHLPRPYVLVGAVVLMSALWSVYLGQFGTYVRQAGQNLKGNLSGGHNLFVLFTSSGFLATAVANHPAQRTVMAWLQVLFVRFGPAAGVLIIPLIIFVSAFLGIHPLAMVTLLSRLLRPDALGISPHVMAASLLVGLSTAAVVSPFSGIVGIVSSLMHATPLDVGPRWNWRYGLSWFLTAQAGLYLFVRTVS